MLTSETLLLLSCCLTNFYILKVHKKCIHSQKFAAKKWLCWTRKINVWSLATQRIIFLFKNISVEKSASNDCSSRSFRPVHIWFQQVEAVFFTIAQFISTSFCVHCPSDGSVKSNWRKIPTQMQFSAFDGITYNFSSLLWNPGHPNSCDLNNFTWYHDNNFANLSLKIMKNKENCHLRSSWMIKMAKP